MKGKMAVLGPAGTFSESAARAYLKREGLDLELSFYPTIDETADAVGAECCCGLLPLENTLDGYVQGTLDLLLEKDFTALGEIRVPVQFALVANVRRPEEIRTVYVQFKAQGQCRHALHQLAGAQVINTHSNTQSFELVQRGIPGEGAGASSGAVPLSLCAAGRYRRQGQRHPFFGGEAQGRTCQAGAGTDGEDAPLRPAQRGPSRGAV